MGPILGGSNYACKCMVILRDFPFTVHCLGWCHIMIYNDCLRMQMVTNVPKGCYQHPVELVISMGFFSSSEHVYAVKDQALQSHQAFGCPLVMVCRCLAYNPGA